LKRGGGEPEIVDADAVVFHRHAANFPWRSHAVWIITQMIRWGQVREPFDIQALATRVYRPELYRAAAASLGLALPDHDYKREGFEPGSAFFGGETFDPQAAIGSLRALPIRAAGTDLEAFAELNL